MIDLGLAAKVRPCLILSIEFRDDERAVVTYVPRTTSLRGGRFEVEHRHPQFQPGAFDAQTLNTVPAVKLMRLLARIDQAALERIETAVCTWMALRRVG